MDIFLLIIIVIIGFIYLSGRISNLEEQLRVFRSQEDLRDLEEKTRPQVVKESSPVVPQESAIPEKMPVYTQQAPRLFSSANTPKTEGSPAQIQQTNDSQLEFKLGSKLATGVGAVAVIVGMGFFLQYAIENNLINESARVILGFIVGAVLMGVGEFARQKYPQYGPVLSGTGLGVWYLSLYAAFNLYHFVTQPVAFVGMIFVTACGIALALRYNSLPLAVFAQLGGFLTPFMLSGGSNSPHTLFGYIAILDIGVLVVARWKSWKLLSVESFIGTALVYALWFSQYYTSAQYAVAQGYATLFFAIFLLVSLVHFFVRHEQTDESDFALLVINSALYYGASYAILNPLFHDWMGLFTVAFALLYFSLALIIKEQSESGSKLRLFLWSIGIILLIIAVPIQFEKYWITIAWAALGFALAALDFKLNSRTVRFFSYAVFVLTFFRVIIFDSMFLVSPTPDGLVWANTRMFTFYFVFIFLSGAIALLWHRRDDLEDDEKTTALPLLMFADYAATLWVLSAQIHDFHKEFWYPILWSVCAAAGGFVSLYVQSKFLRVAVYLTFIASAIHLLVFESDLDPKLYTPIFNERAFAFFAVILAIAGFAWALRKYKEVLEDDERQIVIPVSFLAANFLTLWMISREVIDIFKTANIRNMALSVVWTFYAIILLGAGIIRKSSVARLSAIFLLGIVVFKVFLFDTSNLDTFYRFVSFITLGVILLLTGYLYNRF